jgi:hypothetical protein
MTNQHPITPPPELVQQWIGDYYGCPVSGELAGVETAIATRAAQWGADQELEACCEWFVQDWTDIETADKLRAARRPKPPSLKEQALDELCISFDRGYLKKEAADTIRRALEQLDD